MCRSVTHPSVFFSIIFWKLRQEQGKMDGGNFSAMTGFIFLGIVGNTEDKVTIYHGSNCLSHWPMANLGMMLLLEMDPQLHTSMYFCLSHLFFCDLCYSQQLCPRCWWTNLSKTIQSPSVAVLWRSLSSVSLQILNLFCWQWWPMTGIRPSTAPCSMQSACPAGCVPCSCLGFTWWEWKIFETHNINILLMFLWVKWD